MFTIKSLTPMTPAEMLAQEGFVRGIAVAFDDHSEDDEVAATIPEGWLKTLGKDRRQAVLVARRFCELGATEQRIDNLADAIERRAAAMMQEAGDGDHHDKD